MSLGAAAEFGSALERIAVTRAAAPFYSRATMNNSKYSRRYPCPKLKDAIQHAGSLVGEVHPTCKSLPKISARDFDNLVDSIKEHGLLVPICINQDRQLLDGRSRLMACRVAGVAIAADDVKVTEHTAEAIAQSNVARRHLTVDQRLLRAADRLTQIREQAAARKTAGAEKGRENRKNPDLANDAKSKTKPRAPSSAETVAKEDSVPRDVLAVTEKVLEKNPELRPKIEAGELSIDMAADIAGVSRKQPKPKKRKSQKKKAEPVSHDDGVATDCNAMTQHRDGVREFKAPGVSVLIHPEFDASILVYGHDDRKYIGATDDAEHAPAEPDSCPVGQAIEYLKEKLSQMSPA